jgi:peptide/nickel transport system permease protein
VLLGLVSILISFAIGTALGALAASRQGGLLDTIAPPVTLFVGSFPYFFLALALLWVVGYRLAWLPTGHAFDDTLLPAYSWTFVWSVVRHLCLPALTLVAVSIGGWVLAMRNTMIGVLAEDYLMMAEAKGLSRRRITWRYAARNALLPSVSSFGLAIGFVFAGQVLTEIVFSYPGIGYQLLLAVNNLDYPLMQALFLLITAGVLIANLLVDVLLLFLDPRIRDAQVRAA